MIAWIFVDIIRLSLAGFAVLFAGVCIAETVSAVRAEPRLVRIRRALREAPRAAGKLGRAALDAAHVGPARPAA